jgi:hypothetical protein
MQAGTEAWRRVELLCVLTGKPSNLGIYRQEAFQAPRIERGIVRGWPGYDTGNGKPRFETDTGPIAHSPRFGVRTG